MKTQIILISSPHGLHTRPATKFVQEAKKFSCDIFLQKGEKKETAKSLLKILKLGIVTGDSVELITDGEDEDKAIEFLSSVINNLEG